MKVVASWSGGKESCFACYKAMLDGFEVSRLLNFVSNEERCMSHGLDPKLWLPSRKQLESPSFKEKLHGTHMKKGSRLL